MGMVLMGATGLAMGWVIHSPLLMIIAGTLGLVVGGFIGWIGGRRYMFIICLGVLIGAFLGIVAVIRIFSSSPQEAEVLLLDL